MAICGGAVGFDFRVVEDGPHILVEGALVALERKRVGARRRL